MPVKMYQVLTVRDLEEKKDYACSVETYYI